MQQLNILDTNATQQKKIQEILGERQNRFESRRKRRLENAQNGADRHHKLSLAHYLSSKRMASCIPMGQPIQIGHHSEGRDRRFRNRIWNKMGQSVKASETATYYEDKITTIENNQAISSDDPNAIAKLTAKVAEAVRQQEYWKDGNKIVKSKKLSIDQKIEQLKESGHDPAILEPQYGRIGYPSFQLTNNNSNIRRMELRLASLKRSLINAVEKGNTEESYPEFSLVIRQARTIDRVQLLFDGKPSAEIRAVLKSNGFRWAPSEGAWQRHLNGSGYRTQHVLDAIQKVK